MLNTGAAFSLFGDSASPERVRWLLVGFSLIAAIIVAIVLARMGRRITATTFGLALILGGGIGNAYDRIRTGAVIDFFEVHIVHYHWPDLNVADSCIVVGGILLGCIPWSQRAPKSGACPVSLPPPGTGVHPLTAFHS